MSSTIIDLYFGRAQRPKKRRKQTWPCAHLPDGPEWGYGGDVAKKDDKAETKLRVPAAKLELYRRAAERDRRSLNVWIEFACDEKAERDGVPPEAAAGKPGKAAKR
jgi:hypothetical protein